MNNIYLVNPSTDIIEPDRPVSPPLGISSIAAYLLERGIDANIVLDDGYLMRLRETDKDSNELIKRRIEQLKPKIFGTSLFSGAHSAAFDLLKFAKSSGSLTVAGGVDATINYERYLRSGFIDYIVRGEGELAFFELSESILRNKSSAGIPNVSYNVDGQVVSNEMGSFLDVECLPFPAFYLLPDFKSYSGGRALSVEESRGCPYNCSFCAIQGKGKVIRLKSPERLGKEIVFALERYNPTNIRFISENILLQESRALEIAKNLSGYGIPWMINAHPQLVNTRANILPFLRESGLTTVEIGIESGSNRVLKLFNKSTTTETNSSALTALCDAGIPKLRIEYIMFNPLMNFDDLLEAFGFIEKHIALFLRDSKFPKQLFTEMYVENGTPFFERVREIGLLEELTGDKLKREFRANYADPRVDLAKKRVMLLKNRIKSSPSEYPAEKIVRDYKQILSESSRA